VKRYGGGGDSGISRIRDACRRIVILTTLSLSAVLGERLDLTLVRIFIENF